MKIKLKLSPQEKEKLTFVEALSLISTAAKENETITLAQIFHILSGKGYAALLILFSFPFCLPIQIPGFSTPFGLILIFLGLRVAFGKRLWWPKWILNKSFSSSIVDKLVNKTIYVMQKMQKFFHPRLQFLTKESHLHRLHGLVVAILAIFLSLPLPIPFTNMLAALPILSMGLGLLEDDGVFILIAYGLALVCIGLFLALFLFGKSYFAN